MPVWWVAPIGDRLQHGTADRPPYVGGPALTLCEGRVDVPAFVDVPLEARPFCVACVRRYLETAAVEPLWRY